MAMKFKVQLLDGLSVRRALTRLSYEIVEKSTDLSDVILVGIKTRGVPMMNMIAANIESNAGVRVPTCALDITFYRDDLSTVADMPKVQKPSFDVDLNGREVVLVDDVLYTGRTARAAIDAVFSIGRPSRIRLAVLVDRGHRELPIRPDYIGKNVPTSVTEVVRVNFEETDGKMNVELYEKEAD